MHRGSDHLKPVRFLSQNRAAAAGRTHRASCDGGEQCQYSVSIVFMSCSYLVAHFYNRISSRRSGGVGGPCLSSRRTQDFCIESSFFIFVRPCRQPTCMYLGGYKNSTYNSAIQNVLI